MPRKKTVKIPVILTLCKRLAKSEGVSRKKSARNAGRKEKDGRTRKRVKRGKESELWISGIIAKDEVVQNMKCTLISTK